jgi:hypothetical protein
MTVLDFYVTCVTGRGFCHLYGPDHPDGKSPRLHVEAAMAVGWVQQLRGWVCPECRKANPVVQIAS